jgi:hypothetical protein
MSARIQDFQNLGVDCCKRDFFLAPVLVWFVSGGKTTASKSTTSFVSSKKHTKTNNNNACLFVMSSRRPATRSAPVLTYERRLLSAAPAPAPAPALHSCTFACSQGFRQALVSGCSNAFRIRTNAVNFAKKKKPAAGPGDLGPGKRVSTNGFPTATNAPKHWRKPWFS